MDIYQDVIKEFKAQGYEVDFLKERQTNNDPLSARYEFFRPHFRIEKKKLNYWVRNLSSPAYNKVYDILFVIDGQGIHPVLFEILRKRNPQIKCVNYLFDTTYGVYHFERNFDYFDRVFTFDLSESKRFNIGFLPIYWVENSHSSGSMEHLSFFGMGAYNEDRYEVFSMLYDYSQKFNLHSYIKLYEKLQTKEWIYAIKCRVRKVLGLPAHLSLERYHSPIISQQTISPQRFREMIFCSDVVIDTHPEHQDGLTARFMWALGAGKKIVTTNESITQYDFYTSQQVYVLKKGIDLSGNKEFESFIDSTQPVPQHVRSVIDEYRIDNWLRTICT